MTLTPKSWRNHIDEEYISTPPSCLVKLLMTKSTSIPYKNKIVLDNKAFI